LKLFKFYHLDQELKYLNIILASFVSESYFSVERLYNKSLKSWEKYVNSYKDYFLFITATHSNIQNINRSNIWRVLRTFLTSLQILEIV
jgi:predicted AlkP superfamily pyrophosphatase or phosphodiesterase